MSSLGSPDRPDDAAEMPETTPSANGTHGDVALLVATPGDDATVDASDEAAATEEVVAADATTADATTADATTADAAADATAGDDAPTNDDGSAFLTELARAMQTTATAEKARLSEDIERRRSAHLAVVDDRRKAEATSMRELADADLKSIDAWAEDERKRIQDERERRATALQSDLETSLAEHGAKVDREVEAVEAAITAHRADVEAFFAALEQETDPVAIAQHAGKRPAFPALEAIGSAVVGGAGEAADDASTPVAVMTPPGGSELAESWAAWNGSPADLPVGETAAAAAPDAEAPDGGPSDQAAPLPVTAVMSGNGKVLQSVPSSRPMSWLRRDQSANDRPNDDR